MSEADIHFEFYHHLQKAINNAPERGNRTYKAIKPEYREDIRGSADLVLFDETDDPVLVIEAKRPSNGGGRDIDPYSPRVIRQSHDYASQLGCPYFATYNGERLVLFRTFEEGRQLLRRSTKSYDISSTEKFANTLLDEIARLEAEEAKWDSLDDAFIERVKSLHEQLSPELQTELANHLKQDEDFRDSFVSWANAQGIEYDDMDETEQTEARENFANQAAYLLINKIIFYKILESSQTYAQDIRPLAVSIHRVREDLEDHFNELVDQVDFEAVFEHDQIYSEIPLEAVSERVREFVIELDDQDLTQFDSDVIGRIYEGVIPPDRRHEMGEYYTPPAICDLITRLTVTDSNDRVLDPACGSGGFLVSAYHRKQELLPEPQGSHSRILDNLYGVDINRFPAHLTAINLAIQDLSSYTERVNIEINDFFNVTPDTMRFGRKQATTEGSKEEKGVIEETVGGVDAIVANPPYIDQRNIDDREKIRDHLSRVDGEYLSKMSDIYSYFVTHGTEFLVDGGRLGFITSDRWLDTKYGTDLQQFVLENFTVDAIINFTRQAFEDALVGTCILILTKEEDGTIRDEHIAKFIRVNESLNVDEIESVVKADHEPNQMIRRENLQIVTRQQQDLYEEDKWSVFFKAPPIYFDILGQGNTIELADIAEINRGITSGANDFYYGRTEEWEELGLDEYVEPLLKASGQVNKIEFDEEAAKEWAYLSIHDLVKKALNEGEKEYRDQEPAEKVKKWLADNCHTDLVEYIEWGEDQGFHERQGSDMQGRDIWFDLGEIQPSPILMTRFTWGEHRIIWNKAGAIITNQFYVVTPDCGIDPKVLCGILNSRLTWLMCELKGRWTGGQGMARVVLTVYEAEQLPIPDPRQFSEEQCEEIKARFDQLIERENELGEDVSVDATEKERDDLDQAVLATIEMEDRLNELKADVERLVNLRREGAGEATEVLIERTEEKEVIELEGVVEARESARLSDFE